MTALAIAPHPLTRESIPAEGATVGYTGQAFYGDDCNEHGYLSCALRITAHTVDGFYAVVADAMFPGQQDEVFVLLGDEGRQILHGYQA